MCWNLYPHILSLSLINGCVVCVMPVRFESSLFMWFLVAVTIPQSASIFNWQLKVAIDRFDSLPNVLTYIIFVRSYTGAVPRHGWTWE